MKKYEFQIRIKVLNEEPLFKYVKGIRNAYETLTLDIEFNVRVCLLFDMALTEYRIPTLKEIREVALNGTTEHYNIVTYDGTTVVEFTISLFNK